ncbi:hypothetical protein [Achromobacter piechaudii]|uniref:Uncharacterized protein n=1 Tax=Achromobacter piechaudii TaxID=72556 RepID=A0A6S7DPH3_9BURK|nr:hypothetical protein [Achromobacter piechaudii]CAB3870397.1 hypothetical protein LMG1861_02732 [Achromobacter piechaudii]
MTKNESMNHPKASAANEESDTGKSQANQPKDDTEAAHDSGQFGADKPGFGKDSQPAKRPEDKKPNTQGAQFEEGGQYPGKRPEGQ